MQKVKIAAVALALITPAAVVGAPSIIEAFSNFVMGRPAPATLTGAEILPAVQSGATTALPLGTLATYLNTQALPDISLSGTATIPVGNHQVNAAPASVLTLPVGAPVGTLEYVSDYQGGAGTTPISVATSSDATIVGVTSPYQLTVPFQATGFRKTALGSWQPY